MTNKRGNPNQSKLVEKIRNMGYKVKVKYNQIWVEGYEPMTINLAKEFISCMEEDLKYHTEVE